MTEQERATALQERCRAAGLVLVPKMHGTLPYYVLMDTTGLPVARGSLSTVELCPNLPRPGSEASIGATPKKPSGEPAEVP